MKTESELEQKFKEQFDLLKMEMADRICLEIKELARLYKPTRHSKASELTGMLAFLHVAFHDTISHSFMTSAEYAEDYLKN